MSMAASITLLVHQYAQDDRGALDGLLPLVYVELQPHFRKNTWQLSVKTTP